MLGLMYKDIKVCKGAFIGLLICLLSSNLFVFLPYFADNKVYSNTGEGYNQFLGLMCIFAVFLSFYVGGMLQEIIITSDERKKWAHLMSATSDGIKKQVGSKYILMVLYSMITAFFCIFMNSLITDIIGENVPPTSGLIMTLFFIQLMVRSINAPFIFAFSSKYGNTVRLGALMIIGTAALIYGLFGDISWINMDKIWEKLIYLQTNMNESIKLIWALVIFFCGVIVLYISSYKLSCRLYLKGVEQYDK